MREGQFGGRYDVARERFSAREFCPWNSSLTFPSELYRVFLWIEFNEFAPRQKLRDVVGNHHCYKKKKKKKKRRRRSVDKSAYAHLRRFNIINKHVDVIVIMYFWRK